VDASGRGLLLVAPVVLLATGCGGQENYAEGLKQPPTAGVPTVGPGSGEALAGHLHYTMQKNNPETKFADASCPDVKEATPGATVTCEMTVGEKEQEKREFKLRMDNDGIRQIRHG
jgi:hypothetical protein